MSSFSMNNPVFRGAIALNNIGVDLLERRCYQQALHTLMDATTVMKLLFSASPSDNHNEQKEAMVQTGVAAMLERAHQRTSRPLPMMEQQAGASPALLNLNDHHEQIVHQQQPRPQGSSEQNAPCHFYKQQQEPSQDALLLQQLDPIYYPIRIEDVSPDARAPGSLNDPDVQAAIALYNFGLANLCLAQVAGGAHSKQDPRLGRLQQAIYLLQLADELMDQACAEIVMASEQEEQQQQGGDVVSEDYEFIFRQMACIHMAVLGSLARALALSSCCASAAALGDDATQLLQSEAEAIQERLSCLRVNVQAMDQHAMQWGGQQNRQFQTAAAA